eukprot:1157336-Pelagomonas_calceolata.AAC.7
MAQGSYAALDGGSTLWALEALTGDYVFKFKEEPSKKFSWTQLPCSMLLNHIPCEDQSLRCAECDLHCGWFTCVLLACLALEAIKECTLIICRKCTSGAAELQHGVQPEKLKNECKIYLSSEWHALGSGVAGASGASHVLSLQCNQCVRALYGHLYD